LGGWEDLLLRCSVPLMELLPPMVAEREKAVSWVLEDLVRLNVSYSNR
jgi:hypothetical protein